MTLYTQSQVQIALQRATVAMLLISQKIASQFLFFNSGSYKLYKELQYDIYNLYSTITYELNYQSFSSTPSSYEFSFYALVGVMIEKTKTVDVFGGYNGASSPYYQAPGTVVNVVNPIFYLPPMDIYWVQLDPATQTPDGNRSIYYNTAFKGYNPMLWLASPMGTRLFNGTDYSLLPTGGFMLISDLSDAGTPGMASGQVLVITGYESA